MEYPETSLTIAIPEELGVIDNVWVHITLKNGQYVSMQAEHFYRYHSDDGTEWPLIFEESSKQLITDWHVADNNNLNSSIFGIIYVCYNESYLNGSFCITFTSFKNDILKSYYTETREFLLDIDVFRSELKNS